MNQMSLAERRAIKIVELQEEKAELCRIIYEFIYPSDSSREAHRAFLKKAAKLAGCVEPVWKADDGKEHS